MSQIQFEGEETFSVSRETLWNFMTDLRNVPRCTPNLRDPQFPSPGVLTGKLDSTFAFLKGSMEMKMELMDLKPQESARLVITVHGMGNRAAVTVNIQLEEPSIATTDRQQSTKLKWKSESRLEGLLRAVSKGLVEGVARKLIADTFAIVHRELAAAR